MPTRAENRRRTLQTLSDAAIDLFESDGPTVTVDAIAERAGLSRRTVFRHVESKEELAFIHPLLWFDAFNASLATTPGEPLAARLQAASRAIAVEIDDDPDPPRRAFLVAATHPGLSRGFQSLYQRWVDRIADVVDESSGGSDPFRARIVGSAVMGMVDAVTRAWLLAEPDVTYAELGDQGFAAVAPLLDALETPER